MEIFKDSSYENIVTGRTKIEGNVWIGFSEAKDYDIDEETGADVVLEFEKDSNARKFIESLEEELKKEDEKDARWVSYILWWF